MMLFVYLVFDVSCALLRLPNLPLRSCFYVFFFFNDTATTEIYTLSLHDALPISDELHQPLVDLVPHLGRHHRFRSEEHTSELQSPCNLVCRLLLEKKKIEP